MSIKKTIALLCVFALVLTSLTTVFAASTFADAASLTIVSDKAELPNGERSLVISVFAKKTIDNSALTLSMFEDSIKFDQSLFDLTTETVQATQIMPVAVGAATGGYNVTGVANGVIKTFTDAVPAGDTSALPMFRFTLTLKAGVNIATDTVTKISHVAGSVLLFDAEYNQHETFTAPELSITLKGTTAVLKTDATLSALSATPATLAPAFAAGTLNYTASVANSVSSVTIAATKNDADATITAADLGAKALVVGPNTFTVHVTAQDTTVTKAYTIVITRAEVVPVTYTLTKSPVTNGSITVTPDTTTYNAGTSVQVTATPAAGYRFVAFTGASTSTTSPATFVMDGNKSIGATFELIPVPTSSLTIASVSAKKGDVIEVPVTIAGVASLNVASFRVKYNTAVLTLTDVTSAFTTIVKDTATAGEVGVGLIGGTLTSPTTIATLKFTVAADAVDGDSIIDLISAKYAVNGATADTDVATLADGTVTIASFIPGDVDGDGTIELSDALALFNHLAATPGTTALTPAQLLRADADGLAGVNALDVAKILLIATK